jgi:xylan 1,4-beta-xylosidase
MGKPVNPTQTQIEELRHAAQLPPAEIAYSKDGKLSIVLPPQGLAVVVVK